MNILKIIVIGDSKTGKSTLVSQFAENEDRFKDDEFASDFAQRKIELGGMSLIIQIWDVAGQDKDSSSITRQFSRDANGAICVSDINIPCILAVNKYDLVQEYEEMGNEIEDYMEDKFLEVFCNKYNFIGFKKISAKHSYTLITA